MLARLRHDTFVGGYDKQDDVDSVSAREHILDESLVSGNVDKSEMSIAAGEISESDVDRNPAFLLFLESIRINAGKGLDQRGLSMIDVVGCGYYDSFHSALGVLRQRIRRLLVGLLGTFNLSLKTFQAALTIPGPSTTIIAREAHHRAVPHQHADS